MSGSRGSEWFVPVDQGGPGDYRGIADTLDRAVETGELRPGDRLPAHRALARRLGVAVTTVSRAYQEAKRRGLVTTGVGRGTFVRGPGAEGLGVAHAGPVDLTMNSLFPRAFTPDLQRVLGGLQGDTDLSALFDYQPPGGLEEHRAACARWLGDRRFAVEPDRLLISAGGQHAMTVAASTLVRRRGTLLVGELTCHGIHDLARQLGLGLHGVAMDAAGVVPEALDEACRETDARVLYVMPAMQNPTGINMPEERRVEVAEAARRLDLQIVEDDAYGFLDPVPPLAVYAPERTTYLASMGKVLWPGLRIGLVVPPVGSSPKRMEGAIAATAAQAAPWMAAVVASCIRTGLALEVMQEKRERLRARGEAARRALPEGATASHPLSPHLWIPLPPPWSSADFTARLEERDVLVSPGDEFAVSRAAARPAVRICLGAVARGRTVQHAAEIVAELLTRDPPPRADGKI